MFPIIFFVITLIIALFQIFFLHANVFYSFLISFLVIEVGCMGLYSFIGHWFISDKVAESIGWPKNNPFQKEIAFTNLAFGCLGICCIWFGKEFWMATAIGYSIFLLGAAVVHIIEIIKEKNLNIGNAGPILFADILIPIILLILVIIF